MTLDQLLVEVETRILAGHPGVIVAALDSLLEEFTMEECSYYFYFKSYERQRSLITFLTRSYATIADNEWNTDQSDDLRRRFGESRDVVSRRLSTVLKKIDEIRDRRYERVCNKCAACGTRRKPWPNHVKFITIDSALQVF